MTDQGQTKERVQERARADLYTGWYEYQISTEHRMKSREGREAARRGGKASGHGSITCP